MDIRSSLKNNPPFLLVVLLAVHLLVVLLNPMPGRVGRTFGAQVLMTLFQPFQTLLTMTGSGVGGIKDSYIILKDARAENKTLLEKNATLESDYAKLSEQLKNTEQILKIDNWKPEPNVNVVKAQVIARDATQWYRTVTIDKGSIDGIEKDFPVITERGLVGRVVTVAPTASRILLLTDERHAAGAAIGQATDSRVMGIVQGTSNSYGKSNFRCELKLVGGTGEKPQTGELIVTSGQDGLYPRGLIIGRVVEPLNANEKSPDIVPIEPAAALDKVDVVGVMLVAKDKIRAQVEELTRTERDKEKAEQDKLKQQRLDELQRKKQAEKP